MRRNDEPWEEKKKRRVLITGGAGYVGSMVHERLVEEGYPVKIVDTAVGSDARDKRVMKRALRDVDVVVPLASMVGAQVCNRNPEKAKDVNVETIKVLLAARSKEQLIVFPTSGSSGSVYGHTKIEAEKRVMGTPNAMTICLATVFGIAPRMRLNSFVNCFAWEAVTTGKLTVFDRALRRNYVHVRDVADSVIYCIEHSGTMIGKSYNCCLANTHYSKGEVAEMVKAKVPGLKVRYAKGNGDMDKQSYWMQSQLFVVQRTLVDGIRELVKEFICAR